MSLFPASLAAPNERNELDSIAARQSLLAVASLRNELTVYLHSTGSIGQIVALDQIRECAVIVNIDRLSIDGDLHHHT